MDLKEEWKCEDHNGTCYRKDNKHFTLKRWKLKTWAAAIAAKTTTPRDPPVDLFRDDDARPSFPVKARGRGGPRHTPDQGESDATRLISAVIPHITSLSQNIPLHRTDTPKAPSMPRRLKRTYTLYGDPNPTSSHSDSPPSSPPPPVELELKQYVEAFGHTKSLDENTVIVIFEGLHTKGYSPDGIDVIRVEQIAELRRASCGFDAICKRLVWKNTAKACEAHLISSSNLVPMFVTLSATHLISLLPFN